MPPSVTSTFTVTVRPPASVRTARHFAALPDVPAFFAVTVNDAALPPAAGEKVAQFPPALGSSVLLQVSLVSVKCGKPVQLGSLGVSVAVSPVAVNCTDPGVVAVPLEQASTDCVQTTDTIGVGSVTVIGSGVDCAFPPVNLALQDPGPIGATVYFAVPPVLLLAVTVAIDEHVSVSPNWLV
jgi:hypothetical protein